MRPFEELEAGKLCEICRTFLRSRSAGTRSAEFIEMAFESPFWLVGFVWLFQRMHTKERDYYLEELLLVQRVKIVKEELFQQWQKSNASNAFRVQCLQLSVHIVHQSIQDFAP